MLAKRLDGWEREIFTEWNQKWIWTDVELDVGVCQVSVNLNVGMKRFDLIR